MAHSLRSIPGRMLERFGSRERPARAGEAGHRGTVGPPGNYDVTAAMTFGLLTTLGLREHHRLLDIGCGSLRVGRVLIPYLGKGNYTGIEPERWLVTRGVGEELGTDLVRIKQPHFLYASDASGLDAADHFDFALAQSVFSHTGPDLLRGWLRDTSAHLTADGALVATFVPGNAPAPDGWTAGAVMYKPSAMREMAAEAGLGFELLDWRHPAQTWAIFPKPGFAAAALRGGDRPHWNDFLDDGLASGAVEGTPLDERYGDLNA